jgi:hypothetical protein
MKFPRGVGAHYFRNSPAPTQISLVFKENNLLNVLDLF